MKAREAHLFLLTRHKENPTMFAHPGKFVMWNATLTRDMMDKVSMDKLLTQSKRWNILHKMQTTKRSPQGIPLPGRYFQEYMLEVFEENNGVDADGKVLDEMWELTLSDSMVPRKVNKKWDLMYQKNAWLKKFSHVEQNTMEAGRAELVQTWGTKPAPPAATADGEGAAAAAPGTWTEYILFGTGEATYTP
eukprot:scaffold8397_cov190-Amphora_coffeaeformis.AAC.2